MGGTTATAPGDQFAYMKGPEYGRCLPVPSETGSFANSSCSKAGGKKKYEWFPAFGGPKPLEHTHFTIQGTGVTLETTGAAKVSCAAGSGTGSYASHNEVVGVLLKLTGCTSAAGKCVSTGDSEGEVSTASLAGNLGDITSSKLGTDLKRVGGGPVAEFSLAPPRCRSRGR